LSTLTERAGKSFFAAFGSGASGDDDRRLVDAGVPRASFIMVMWPPPPHLTRRNSLTFG
jgi:hypothetical protein